MSTEKISMSFNQLLAENPLPFSICIKNLDEKLIKQTTKPSATRLDVSEGSSSTCQSITSSLDEVIQIFLCACEKSEIEMEKLFDSLRNQQENKDNIQQQSLEKVYRLVLNISKDVTAQLEEAAEKLFKSIVSAEKEKLLTAPESRYLAEYIRQQANFFNQLRDWMTKMLQDILLKFIQGHSGEEKAASLLFQSVVHILQSSDIHQIINANCCCT